MCVTRCGGAGGAGRGWGRGLPYLDLFGVKGHDEAKEQEGGNTDGAFNQEQVERPLSGGIEKGVRLSLPSSQTAFPSQFPIS